MGCWNGTCMISNLHVTAGQEVIVFMLAKTGYTDNFCYEHSHYTPCPIPFYGEYNDYGAVENCHGFGLDIVVDAIRKQLYEFHSGPNSCHDCEVLKTDFNIDKLFEADHEGRLGIERGHEWDGDDYDRQQLEKIHTEDGLSESQARELDRLANKIKKVDTFRAVTHVIIHGDIFKAITDKFFLEEYVGDGGNCGYDNHYLRTTFQDIIDDIPGYIDKIKAEDADDKDTYAKWKRRSGTSDDYNHSNRVVRRLSYMNDSSSRRNYAIINPSEYIEEYIEAKNWEGLAAFVKELMTTYWISTFMSSTRKHWTKMTGAGSQSNEADGYIVLSKATLDIIGEEKVKWGEDEDYDEDDVDEESREDASTEAE